MIQVLDIIAFILNWINSFFLFMVIGCFLDIRQKLPVKVVAYGLCILIANIVIFANDITNIIGVLIGFILFTFILYQDIWICKLSAVIILYPMIVSINYLAQDTGMQIYFYIIRKWELNTENIFISTLIHTISLAIAPVIWFSIWQILKRRNIKSISLLNTKMWLMIDGVCLSVFIAVLVTLNFMPENSWMGYPICLSGIITIFACLYLTLYIADSILTEYQLQTMKKKHKYYEEKLQEEERVRSIYHDMKNHLLVLENQSGTDYAKEIAKKLRMEISDYEDYIHTGSDILDVIIKEKSRMARENNIDFSVTVDFSGVYFIEPLDISTIFGNSIDNALEATGKLPEEYRAVIIKAGIVHSFVMIVIENTCPDVPEEKSKTTKDDKFLHGFGIGNIKKTVEKYNGEYTSDCKDRKYILKILIPVSDERKSVAK
ncbi:MAG: GHKL domain-containing protein [Ruminococcus sp.]|nr:GHKL domain-containing protein [Ruminococcus sp.]